MLQVHPIPGERLAMITLARGCPLIEDFRHRKSFEAIDQPTINASIF